MKKVQNMGTNCKLDPDPFFEISLMKIEKYVKNRGKQSKVGHLIITYLASKFSNMATMPSENILIFKKSAQT